MTCQHDWTITVSHMWYMFGRWRHLSWRVWVCRTCRESGYVLP